MLPQASKAYQIALQLYQQGEATYLEALTAQAAFVELRADAAQAAALAERLRLDLQLLTSNGGGK
ncbi:MAG: hypothetical protein DYG96_10770 [Chlorobi bacterium CHB2]|nr:hypothetical protein [Chlorobi bacterium CHB2]